MEMNNILLNINDFKDDAKYSGTTLLDVIKTNTVSNNQIGKTVLQQFQETKLLNKKSKRKVKK